MIFNTPPQDRAAISKANLGSELFSAVSGQGLGEEVGKLILVVDMMNL
jgi:hypothetical protein